MCYLLVYRCDETTPATAEVSPAAEAEVEAGAEPATRASDEAEAGLAEWGGSSGNKTPDSVAGLPKPSLKPLAWDGKSTEPPAYEREPTIMILFAAPLAYTTGTGQVHSIELLDYEQERELLCQTINETGAAIEVQFKFATTDTFRSVVTLGGCRVLHYSGHGSKQFLGMEGISIEPYPYWFWPTFFQCVFLQQLFFPTIDKLLLMIISLCRLLCPNCCSPYISCVITSTLPTTSETTSTPTDYLTCPLEIIYIT